jgi:hypothetical protein
MAAGIGGALGSARLFRRLRERLPEGSYQLSAISYQSSGLVVTLLLAFAVVAARRETLGLVRDAHPDMSGAMEVLQPGRVPSGSTVLASWHYATPLWYGARHLHDQPGLAVDYVHPEGAEPIGETWRRRLSEIAGPAVVTNRPREVRQSDISLWPIPDCPFLANLPLGVEPIPERSSSPDEPSVLDGDRDFWGTFGGLIRLVGFDVGEPIAAGWPGWPLRVAFEPAGPITETLTIVAQLVEPGGNTVWGQVDHSFPAARWSDPLGLVDKMEVLVFRGHGSGNLALGVYRSTDAGPARLEFRRDGQTFGRDRIILARMDTLEELARDAMAETRPPRYPPPPGAVPFGYAMLLLESAVEREGGELIVDLTWRSELAHRSDYTVSVQVHGEGWQAQHDGIPALGAIPTLKWLPGMVIHDRHRIRLPDDLPPDAPYRVIVAVYDAFDFEPLPITDGELVREGQGQAVEIDRAP